MTIIATTIFLSSQTNTAKDLFLLKPEYKKITINNQVYYCFDNFNVGIVVAKHEIIRDLFMPITNCQYSNMILEIKKNEKISIENRSLVKKNIKYKSIIAILSGIIAVLVVVR